MSKIINISEEKHKKALREIFKEEVLNKNGADPQHPFGRKGTDFEGVEDGHGESIVGDPVDPTVYDKNAPDGIVNA